MMLQAWDKPEIVWSVSISLFNELVKLASTNQNSNDVDSTNYIVMIEKKDKSRIATNIYFDEKKSEVFANSFESEVFIISSNDQSENLSNSLMNDISTNNQTISDDENELNRENENLKHRYMMIETLSAEIHDRSSQRTSFIIDDHISEENQNMSSEDNINRITENDEKWSDTKNNFDLNIEDSLAHVIYDDNNASSEFIMKISHVEHLTNIIDEANDFQYESAKKWAEFDD